MPRLSYVGALLAVVAFLPALALAQKPAPNSAQNSVTNGPRVQHVIVRGSGPAMEVEIQTSGTPVAPDTQAITAPDRIVVDFPGALPAAEAFAGHSRTAGRTRGRVLYAGRGGKPGERR